jgi:undecaprenyl diphosphate synthase
LCIIGDIDKFSPTLQQKIAEAQRLTQNNTGLIVNIAANYGGRWDITQSVRHLAQKVASGELKPEDINEEDIGASLSTSALPEPDLFIRTGGEQRVSNFLLWQMAYTEFFFTDVLWPEFDSKQLDAAISSFSKRERRFGRTSEQLQGQSDA